ncbi:MAG: alpha/beta fold hydrolase [Alphaproteobacteria bacterium]|nr:alpha/beta fold hydrolase [Alphaproteobacteria bacterium]
MAAPETRWLAVNGAKCRVRTKGTGRPIGFLAGLDGALTWTPFLERLAGERQVIVASLPGFAGSNGHDRLDQHLDWLLATEELLRGAGLAGADLIGSSVGGALAADVAAVWPGLVRKLALIAPFGLYDEGEPTFDVFAVRPGTLQNHVCANPENFAQATAQPAGEDAMEWQVTQLRTNEAAARLLWPLGDTRLALRLPRLTTETLLVWGADDRVVPPSYAGRFQKLIKGKTTIATIAGAGHLAELDAPDAVAAAILEFLG